MTVTLTIEIAHAKRCKACGGVIGTDPMPVNIREVRDVGNPLLVIDYLCGFCSPPPDDEGDGRDALPAACEL